MGWSRVLPRQQTNVMSLSSQILFTLLYADIFQYPYTFDELIGWMPKNRWDRNAVQKQIRYLLRIKSISYKTPFYTLYGHTGNIATRVNRERIARDKWKKARRAANILRLIPTILFVGVTGGLSMQNADEGDDVDFFICAKKGTLWITRFFSTLLLEICGIRRHPESKVVKDAICLNMFVTENALAVLQSQRDMYIAHEVLQMKPLWEREHAYRTFLLKNRWVSSIFPYKWKEVLRNILRHPESRNNVRGKLSEGPYFDNRSVSFDSSAFGFRMIVSLIYNFQLCCVHFLRLLEKPAKHIQLWYMKRRRTSEVVSDTIIRFHPHDARNWIPTFLWSKSKKMHLPLDKNFFHP